MLRKLIFPYTENGKRRDHQHPLNLSVLIHAARNGNTHKSFSCPHLHQKRHALALALLIEYPELVASKRERALLMLIRCCLDRHHQFNALTHSHYLILP